MLPVKFWNKVATGIWENIMASINYESKSVGINASLFNQIGRLVFERL